MSNTNWGDYGITAKRYNGHRTHIESVKAAPNQNGGVGTELVYTRQTVVNSIEAGQKFVTLFRNGTGGWTLGSEVRVVMINNIKYLRTDANRVAADNLENLPEF